MAEKVDRVITGFRPTSDLTVGNYLGAIKPSVEMQNNPANDLYCFVADMHALTDSDPREVAPYRHEVVRDCMALGIDPDKSTIYMQSSIEAATVQIANRIAPYVGVGELARTPNIKEKIKAAVKDGEADSEDAFKANYALLGYPVLMAADIFAQQAELVAVGEDQEPHLELARQIARKFNNTFGSKILVIPKITALESLRILSLDGKGKMSKTNPNQAILLTDDPEKAQKKIKGATTVGSGEWNEVIESHFMVAEALAETEEEREKLAELKQAHLDDKPVMKDFKELWAEITGRKLGAFQTAKAKITDDEVRGVLLYSGDKARKNADETLTNIRDVMGF